MEVINMETGFLIYFDNIILAGCTKTNLWKRKVKDGENKDAQPDTAIFGSGVPGVQ